MKDYNDQIKSIALEYESLSTAASAMKRIEAIIRADVEAEEERLKKEIDKLDGLLLKLRSAEFGYEQEIERLRIRIVELEEENENLKDLNNQLQLQAKEQPPTREQREWEMFKDIIVRDKDSNEGHFRWSANLAKRAVSVFYDFQKGGKA